MISRNILIRLVLIIVVSVFGIYVIMDLLSTTRYREESLFRGILGDTILKNNETGKKTIANITSYDGFIGNIIQGYKANYSGRNGTVIIFLAQMPDNTTANRSFKDMVIRAGYDNSAKTNDTDTRNKTVVRLPVENPEVFAMRKNINMTWHYTFTKANKVYWIGFDSKDVEYQADMLIEIYRFVDKENNNFDI